MCRRLRQGTGCSLEGRGWSMAGVRILSPGLAGWSAGVDSMKPKKARALQTREVLERLLMKHMSEGLDLWHASQEVRMALELWLAEKQRLGYPPRYRARGATNATRSGVCNSPA